MPAFAGMTVGGRGAHRPCGRQPRLALISHTDWKRRGWPGQSPAMTLIGSTPTMPNPLAIHAHAHICTEETRKLLNKETPKVASALKDIGNKNYEWTVAGVPYRPLPLGGFDIEQRLKDIKTSEVDMQVLSNPPQTFLYNQDAGMTAAACIVQNDQSAKHVRDYPRSFYGIPTLPLQAPNAAADAL